MQAPPNGFVLMITRPGNDKIILARSSGAFGSGAHSSGAPPTPIVMSHGVDRLGVLSAFLATSTSRYRFVHVDRWTDWYLVVTIDPKWSPPAGHSWYHPAELSAQAQGFLPSPRGYDAWRGLLPSSKTIILYHGTTRSAAESIMKHGFKIRACKHGPGKIHCRCSMMGPCVYLAAFDKARDYAVRRPDFTPVHDGVLVRVEVKTAGLRLRTAGPPCTCCDQAFVDHVGNWIRSGASGVWLDDGSLPACRRAELAVADVSILKPLAIISEFERPKSRDDRIMSKSKARSIHGK